MEKLKMLFKENKEVIAYIFFGVLTTGVDWISYTIFRWIGVSYEAATRLLQVKNMYLKAIEKEQTH